MASISKSCSDAPAAEIAEQAIVYVQIDGSMIFTESRRWGLVESLIRRQTDLSL